MANDSNKRGRWHAHVMKLRREKPWLLIGLAAIVGPLYLVWAFVPDSGLVGMIAFESTVLGALAIFWPEPTQAEQVDGFLAGKLWEKPAWLKVVRRRQLVLAGGITPAYTLCQRALDALNGKVEILRQHPGKGEIVALKTYEDGVTQDMIVLVAKLESSTRTRVEMTSRANCLSVPVEHADNQRNVAALESFLERHARIIRD